jgi:hypothetical protein
MDPGPRNLGAPATFNEKLKDPSRHVTGGTREQNPVYWFARQYSWPEDDSIPLSVIVLKNLTVVPYFETSNRLLLSV